MEWGKRKRKISHLGSRTVYQPTELGGLGVLDLELMNVALLTKWLWKLFNEQGLWQKNVVGRIYW